MRPNISILTIFFLTFLIVIFFIDFPFFLNWKLKIVKVGFIILDYGVENFEHLVVTKLLKTESILNVKYNIIKTKNYEEQKSAANKLIKEKNSIIIFYNGIAVQNFAIDLAKNNPEVKFILLDSNLRSNIDNLFIINYNYFHLGILAGILSCISTQNGKIGYIGGIDSGSVLDLKNGCEYAISLYNKTFNTKNKLYYSFINKHPDLPSGINPFSHPATAKNIAHELYANFGCDIIVAVAGNSNRGIYELSKQKKFKIINFDTTSIKILSENNIVFSLICNIDNCIISTLGNILKNHLNPKNYIFDISHNSFSIINSGSLDLSNEDYVKIDLIKSFILEGYEK